MEALAAPRPGSCRTVYLQPLNGGQGGRQTLEVSKRKFRNLNNLLKQLAAAQLLDPKSRLRIARLEELQHGHVYLVQSIGMPMVAVKHSYPSPVLPAKKPHSRRAAKTVAMAAPATTSHTEQAVPTQLADSAAASADSHKETRFDRGQPQIAEGQSDGGTSSLPVKVPTQSRGKAASHPATGPAAAVAAATAAQAPPATSVATTPAITQLEKPAKHRGAEAVARNKSHNGQSLAGVQQEPRKAQHHDNSLSSDAGHKKLDGKPALKPSTTTDILHSPTAQVLQPATAAHPQSLSTSTKDASKAAGGGASHRFTPLTEVPTANVIEVFVQRGLDVKSKRFLVNARSAHSMEQVYDALSALLQVGGGVRRMYSVEGKRITSVDSLYKISSAVAIGPERLDKGLFGLVQARLAAHSASADAMPAHHGEEGTGAHTVVVDESSYTKHDGPAPELPADAAAPDAPVSKEASRSALRGSIRQQAVDLGLAKSNKAVLPAVGGQEPADAKAGPLTSTISTLKPPAKAMTSHVEYLVAHADGVVAKAAQERRRQQLSIKQKFAARQRKVAILGEAAASDAQLESALSEERLRQQKALEDRLRARKSKAKGTEEAGSPATASSEQNQVANQGTSMLTVPSIQEGRPQPAAVEQSEKKLAKPATGDKRLAAANTKASPRRGSQNPGAARRGSYLAAAVARRASHAPTLTAADSSSPIKAAGPAGENSGKISGSAEGTTAGAVKNQPAEKKKSTVPSAQKERQSTSGNSKPASAAGLREPTDAAAQHPRSASAATKDQSQAATIIQAAYRGHYCRQSLAVERLRQEKATAVSNSESTLQTGQAQRPPSKTGSIGGQPRPPAQPSSAATRSKSNCSAKADGTQLPAAPIAQGDDSAATAEIGVGENEPPTASEDKPAEAGGPTKESSAPAATKDSDDETSPTAAQKTTGTTKEEPAADTQAGESVAEQQPVQASSSNSQQVHQSAAISGSEPPAGEPLKVLAEHSQKADSTADKEVANSSGGAAEPDAVDPASLDDTTLSSTSASRLVRMSSTREPAPGSYSPYGVMSEEHLRQILHFHEKLGDGNFADVLRVTDPASGAEYALKAIDKSKIAGEREQQLLRNEIAMMRQVVHPNCIELYDVFETPSHIYLLMELVRGGDLFDYIVKRGKLQEAEAAALIADLASAVAYMHRHRIVHRDLKPENILVAEGLDAQPMLKLCDFGLSMVVDEPLFTICGTPTYVAPEILGDSNQGYGLEIDNWAIGVIMYILLCGFPPFASSNRNQKELFNRIRRGNFSFPPAYWEHVSKEAKDLIRQLLTVDAKQRATAEHVLHHAWVQRAQRKEEDAVRARRLTAKRKWLQKAKGLLAALEEDEHEQDATV